jgi:hypothetical protein
VVETVCVCVGVCVCVCVCVRADGWVKKTNAVQQKQRDETRETVGKRKENK